MQRLTDKCNPQQQCSVEPLNGSHGGLDVQGPHVLPVLLQQRHEEVHGEVDVLDEVLLGHTDVTDGHGQAQDLGKDVLKDGQLTNIILFIFHGCSVSISQHEASESWV